MHILIEYFGLFSGYLLTALTIFFRYAFFAGIAFSIFYVWRRKHYLRLKIQERFPKYQQIWREIIHSAYTAFIFATMGLGIYFLRQHGYTRIYTDIHDYSWGYLVFSFLFLVVLHDTYFYWMHRLMHHPRLFRLLHKVHHQSSNPTPWAALSFHPLEAILEIAIIPIAVFILPFHALVLLLFATWSLLWNIIGHLGFELFPKGFVHHPVFRWFNTSTHHNMHHHQVKCNYGLYFNFWDSWMNTNHHAYKETFDQITQKEKHVSKPVFP